MNNRGDVELVVKTNSAATLSCSAPPTASADAIASDPLSDTSFPENGKFFKIVQGHLTGMSHRKLRELSNS